MRGTPGKGDGRDRQADASSPQRAFGEESEQRAERPEEEHEQEDRRLNEAADPRTVQSSGEHRTDYQVEGEVMHPARQ
jgi:hypothetical protein